MNLETPQTPIQGITPSQCPGAPIKGDRPLILCIPRCKIEGNLFPNMDKEKKIVRPTTPPSRKLPNGICSCTLNECTCCYAPKRSKKSNN